MFSSVVTMCFSHDVFLTMWNPQWLLNDAFGCFSFSFKVRFMLETMLALKNNDMRKIPGYDPQPVERLRKLQRALVSDTLFCFVLSLHASMDSL